MSTAHGERRQRLCESRKLLESLPCGELFELPGRPHVLWQLRSYSNPTNPAEAVQQARNDVPFLFKAFESGQIGPKRMAKMHGGKPRVATIHEYLDWTVSAAAAQEDDELDFGGFRILCILPRYVSHWPCPDHPGSKEGKRPHPELGAPKDPLPQLQTHGKPISAATIRSGPGYMEVPFVATHEGRRGKGYCRCLLEALEDIARYLGLKKLLLCSTNDPLVKSTWQHLAFDFASDEHLLQWDTPHSDLVYLQNTTQMHKDVPPAGIYRPIVIKHGLFQQRLYARLDVQVKRPKLHVFPPKKAPAKRLAAQQSSGQAGAQSTGKTAGYSAQDDGHAATAVSAPLRTQTPSSLPRQVTLESVLAAGLQPLQMPPLLNQENLPWAGGDGISMALLQQHSLHLSGMRMGSLEQPMQQISFQDTGQSLQQQALQQQGSQSVQVHQHEQLLLQQQQQQRQQQQQQQQHWPDEGATPQGMLGNASRSPPHRGGPTSGRPITPNLPALLQPAHTQHAQPHLPGPLGLPFVNGLGNGGHPASTDLL